VPCTENSDKVCQCQLNAWNWMFARYASSETSATYQGKCQCGKYIHATLLLWSRLFHSFQRKQKQAWCRYVNLTTINILCFPVIGILLVVPQYGSGLFSLDSTWCIFKYWYHLKMHETNCTQIIKPENALTDCHANCPVSLVCTFERRRGIKGDNGVNRTSYP